MNYKRIYDSIIERSRKRLVPEGYVERHHIIPRCMGGTDDKENIAVLTPEEHFLCHVLLVKIYPEEKGLIYAVNKMCRGHKGKRKRRKLYGWLKRRYSQQRKIDSIGKGNTQYGTMWINKIGTTENKMIKKDEPVPVGWVHGRRLVLVKKKKSVKNSCCKVCGKRSISQYSVYCKEHKPKKKEYESKRKISMRRTEDETVLLYKKYMRESISLEAVAKSVGISKVALHKRFKRYIKNYMGD